MDKEKKLSAQWGRNMPGELLARWPRDEAGELDAPVYLCHCGPLDMEEALTVSRLESYGIPCLRQYPNSGDFGRLIIGVSGTGVDLFVPASLWADACELLRAPDEEPIEDEDEMEDNQ